MTREQTAQVLALLRGAYPMFYRDITKKEAYSTIELWASIFVDDEFEVVAAAVKALISNDEKGYPPVPGQVKSYIRKITQKEEMNESEAWALVAKAVGNSAYEAKKEFDALPEELKRIVGSPNQLRDWSQMDSSTLHSVVASNFQRAYRVKQQTRKEYNALPGDVKKMIAGVGNKMLLEE